jgi:hypothetical protein
VSGFKLGKGRGMTPEEPERISSWDGRGVDRTFSKPARGHDVEAGQSLEDAVRT